MQLVEPTIYVQVLGLQSLVQIVLSVIGLHDFISQKVIPQPQ